MKLTNKKSQMEILGLAIVVVIILLAMFYVFKFISFQKPSQTRNDFVSLELASDTVNAFLKTTSRDCSQLSMTELLQDCAEGTGFRCDDPASSDSCKYMQSTADEIFGKTLRAWKIKYMFTAYYSYDKSKVLAKSGEACPGEKILTIYPIPISTGQINVELDICR